MEQKIVSQPEYIISEVLLYKRYQIKLMGTSGNREKQEVFDQPGYIEQYAQGLADYFLSLPKEFRKIHRNTVVIGGDPRLGNKEKIDKIAGILAANGLGVVIADNYIASTPAMSHLIRELNVMGGIILTASHNPFTDSGIKINDENGAPALEHITEPIFKFQNAVIKYPVVDLEEIKKTGRIMHVDAVAVYANLMDKIFNFQEMKQLLKEFEIKNGRPFQAMFDGMYGASGPFAKEIFQNILGVGTAFIHCTPDKYLGGYDENGHLYHPEPDFDYVPELISSNASGKMDLVSAWDSDGDRNLNGGNGFWVESADQYCIFAKYLLKVIDIKSIFTHPDGTPKEIVFARSTVTSNAIDEMRCFLESLFGAKGYKIKVVETDTGFKFIAELGNWGVEESNGTGNPFLREKDGIFATLFLMKIMLLTGKTAPALMEEIWKEFGRVYFTRGEVSGKSTEEKQQLTDILNKISKNPADYVGRPFGTLTLESAEKWGYTDPAGKVRTKESVWVFNFSDGNTIKARYSGTGSEGYQLRVYASKYDRNYALPKPSVTQPMKEAFDAMLGSEGFKNKSEKYTDSNQPDYYAEST